MQPQLLNTIWTLLGSKAVLVVSTCSCISGIAISCLATRVTVWHLVDLTESIASFESEDTRESDLI